MLSTYLCQSPIMKYLPALIVRLHSCSSNGNIVRFISSQITTALYLYSVKYFAQRKTGEQYPSLFLDTLETCAGPVEQSKHFQTDLVLLPEPESSRASSSSGAITINMRHATSSHKLLSNTEQT